MSLVELANQIESTSPPASGASARRSRDPDQLYGYDVLGRLGTGAGSVVYEVRDRSTGRRYALKHVTVTDPKHLRFIEQLEREHEVGQAVRHPHLRQPLALHVKRNLLRRVTEAALVLELVDGWPLVIPVKPASLALIYLVQVSRTLEAFHRAGFVHCDLKPHNLLVDRSKRVKLIDLGQSCRIGTVKERVQGTPDFISPEQVRCLAVSPKTDVYNFGATAYCILTGSKIPTLFTVARGENSFLVDDRITPPHEIDPEVPELLSSLVMSCIVLQPNGRPEMADVTRKLEAIHYTLSRRSGGRRAVGE